MEAKGQVVIDIVQWPSGVAGTRWWGASRGAEDQTTENDCPNLDTGKFVSHEERQLIIVLSGVLGIDTRSAGERIPMRKRHGSVLPMVGGSKRLADLEEPISYPVVSTWRGTLKT